MAFSPVQIVGVLVLLFGLGMVATSQGTLASLAAGLACIIGGLLPFHPEDGDEP